MGLSKFACLLSKRHGELCSGLFSQDCRIANSLGREKLHLTLEQRAGLFPNQYNKECLSPGQSLGRSAWSLLIRLGVP